MCTATGPKDPAGAANDLGAATWAEQPAPLGSNAERIAEQSP